MSRLPIRIFAALLVSSLGVAQENRAPQPSRDFSLNVDVELVQLPVSVVDRDGRSIEGLTNRHFRIFEDGVQQEISLFKHEDVPLSVGLVIDNSGSMRNKRERVNSAALTFIRESNPDDETFIVNFDDSAYLEQDFTSNIEELMKTLTTLDTRGETALYDAVYLSADHLREGKRDKKAILLISDGEDNTSKFDLNKTVEALRKSRVAIYAIGLLEESDSRGRVFRRSDRAKSALKKFAEVSGGQAYFPKSLDEVEDICKRIARDLRRQYTIGYSPVNKALDGKWRNVRVQVNPPQNVRIASVRTKPGYYAPTVAAETTIR